MNRTSTIQLMASYNRWMNQRVYEAAARLPASELTLDRKAFFGSILGTLNHLAVGDTLWLMRFAEHPAEYSALETIRALPKPASLNQILFSDFGELAVFREMLDGSILDWVKAINESELDYALEYRNTKGVASQRNFFGLLMHFFNHQTHHRGQVSTLLAQAGMDIGITDLHMLVQDENA